MATHRFAERARALILGIAVAALVAACAGGPREAPPAAQQSQPGAAASTQGPQAGALEEIVISGNRRSGRATRPSNDSAAAISSSALSQAMITAQPSERADTALSEAEPGEEIWIISRPRTRLADTARDDESPGSGAMLANVSGRPRTSDTETEYVPLPLKHTAVHASIAGYVGTVDVTQQFANPFDEKIEAVYLFPLPEKAAISEFVMTIGERRIRGILREREQAEEIYREARAQGYQASLLTQERPNVFEQKVANIEPGKEIDVDIRYFHTLAYHDGWYSFVFPTVVGPRYNPPASKDPVLALSRTQFEHGTATAVRYLRPNERSGHDISIDVDIDAGVAIEEIKASHDISETRTGPKTAHVELASHSTLPNKDFVLDFKVAGDKIKSNLLTYVDSDAEQGYFTLMLYPPSELEALQRQALELVFVLDCSGSMQGQPLAQAKDAIAAALGRLEPRDTFQIIRFSTNASQFGPEPVLATSANIRRARQYLQGLRGSGGTEMIEGIKAALDFPHDPQRFRFVTFLTDGYIGNEADILGAIHGRLGDSRIFSFGVGSSVNRYLLERMAAVGRGAVAYLGPQDAGREIMDLFFDRISHPALIDLDIDWGNMRVSDVYPSRLPDLFVGRPVIVTGKYTGRAAAPTIRGRAAGHRVSFELPQSAASTPHDFLPKLWARLRIADLADRQAWASGPAGELGREIKSTALEYGLMSDYTAFIAVDASRVTEGDHGTTVFQAVPVPEGVRYDTTVER